MSQEVTHGVSKHQYYKRWNDMIQRCYNAGEKSYVRYGALGIEVDPIWDRRNPKGAFNYVEWLETQVAEMPPEMEGKPFLVMRRDVTKNYSPDNCRLVTAVELSQSRRCNVVDFDTVVILRRLKREYEDITLRELSKLFGIKHIYTLSRCLRGQAWANVNEVEPPVILKPHRTGKIARPDIFPQ